ncbi:unnamed protein product [Anisakis simplex]|uniref:Uncharacterized protein n=1 Tax=Anisakis simplex TaxID=6269 RepID=A0A3P6S3Z9_ANISI|nr:unnamed protein product [Anisakis simplex]
MVVTQNDLSNAQSRKQQLESDLIAVRGELRDAKQFQRDLAARVGEFERQIQMQTAEKNRLVDRVADLEKRRLVEMETSRVKLLERVADLKNIRVTLTKKIDLLEAEKRSAETMINETALQREAIERSLTALERENKELYRNCSRLQQQVAQLEMDNGTRLIAMSNRQKEEHEKFVQAIKAEKVQVERIVENRDRIQKTRIKQLENQLNALRELLTSERLRSRRDDGDKLLMMSDFGGKMAGGYGSILAGISGHGASSVGVASSDFGGTLPYGGSALGATTGLGLGGVGLGLGLGLGAASEPPIDLGPVRLVGGATRPGAATLTSATAFDYAFSDVGGSKLASRQMTSSQARSISPIREHPSPPADMSSLKETETVTKPTGSNEEEIKLGRDDELKSQASSSSGSSEGREQKKTTIVVHMKGATTPPPTATKHDSSEHSYSE